MRACMREKIQHKVVICQMQNIQEGGGDGRVPRGTEFDICVCENKHLLLTEFKGRTVSYGPSFFLLDLWLKRKARGP